VRTPNIDRLAGEGVVFDQAFSGCPICSPYRGQLLTGRYGHSNGVVDNEYRLRPGEVTLPMTLRDAGYRSAYVGKCHLGYGPYAPGERLGFDTIAGHNCQHDYYSQHYFIDDTGPFPFQGWAPEGETDLALGFIEEQAAGSPSPFALVLSWGPPHWPYDQYPAESNVYDPGEVDLPGNVPVQMGDFARREIAHYYGNVSALDAQLGRVMQTLDRLGIADNTIVCFSSDHGDHLSSHGYGKPFDTWMHPSMRASKATPYDESVHIPFILRWPERCAGGRRSDTLLGSVDVMPTLLSLCGVGAPEGVQGTDLAHAVTGGPGPDPDSVYLQILGPGWPHRGPWVGCWRGLRTDRHVYARWHNDEYGPMLFDRETDRWEMRNLAGRPECAELQASLESRLRRWIADTQDPFDTGERDPHTGMLMLGQQFIHERWDRPVGASGE